MVALCSQPSGICMCASFSIKPMFSIRTLGGFDLWLYFVFHTNEVGAAWLFASSYCSLIMDHVQWSLTIPFSSWVIDPLVDTSTNIFWELYAVSLYLWHGYGGTYVRILISFCRQQNWWLENFLFRLLRVPFSFKSFNLFFLEKSDFIHIISFVLITIYNYSGKHYKTDWNKSLNCNLFRSDPLPSKNCIKHKNFVPCPYGR